MRFGTVADFFSYKGTKTRYFFNSVTIILIEYIRPFRATINKA